MIKRKADDFCLSFLLTSLENIGRLVRKFQLESGCYLLVNLGNSFKLVLLTFKTN